MPLLVPALSDFVCVFLCSYIKISYIRAFVMFLSLSLGTERVQVWGNFQCGIVFISIIAKIHPKFSI